MMKAARKLLSKMSVRQILSAWQDKKRKNYSNTIMTKIHTFHCLMAWPCLSIWHLPPQTMEMWRLVPRSNSWWNFSQLDWDCSQQLVTTSRKQTYWRTIPFARPKKTTTLYNFTRRGQIMTWPTQPFWSVLKEERRKGHVQHRAVHKYPQLVYDLMTFSNPLILCPCSYLSLLSPT